MRKLISFILLLFFIVPSLFSQLYIDGKPLELTGDMHYIAALPAFRMRGGDGGIELIVHTAQTPRRNSREWLTDASGNRLRFENWLAALDFLYKNGWKTVSAVYMSDEHDEKWYILEPRESEK